MQPRQTAADLLVRPIQSTMKSLAREVDDSGPRQFSKQELASARDIFAERAALFFTPTQALPPKWVGTGRLNVKVPIPVPSWLEYWEVPGYRSPRFWVDQIQRATGKIRWRPLHPARVTFVIYDTYVRGTHTINKAVLDALKVNTTGRRDGRTIHYFGAIVDDNWDCLRETDTLEEYVDDPREIGCRIIVEESQTRAEHAGSVHRVNHPRRRGLTRK